MPIKVLAIDDDIAMTELLTLLLQTHRFEIITANSGLEGIDLLKKRNPDIVLLDLMMPAMDGWEVCKRIRSFSNIPIVVLSALNNPGLVASALDAGADDYLIKPVPSSILVAHIKNLARRSTSQLGPLPPAINPVFS
ncbi:MAG: response regulator [Anaerolineae bacterium]|jgi:two-component system, OmpR family, response regulator MtrA|nr:response regulator [Anaerolineae bacterium]MBT7069280.1 response regulator [Anaerolineae bacterium]MBT7326004.1 response regulator [Anaerolineae bacterium]